VWHVYIVECSDGTYYTGIAKDLQARIAKHNSGKGAKYTKVRLPVTLLWNEEAVDRSAASKREYQIKQLSRKQKTAMINMDL
jgi:putative endonuclease